MLATALGIDSKTIEHRDFDPSSMAKCSSLRIGEAMNPGPVPRGDLLLETVPLVEAKTASLQSIRSGDDSPLG